MKTQVHTYTKFQTKLQHTVQKRIILLVCISALVFFVGQYAVIWASSSHAAAKNLDELETSLSTMDELSREILSNDHMESVLHSLIQKRDPEADEELKHIMWKFYEKVGISNEILVTDREGTVLHSSFGESVLSSYLINYNNAICFNAKNKETDGIYRAVYYEQGYYADTMYVKPILDHSKIIGYATLFLSGSAWNFQLSESNYDGVITDLRDNAMYISKPGLTNGVNKFKGISNGLWRNGNDQYWVASKTCPKLNAVIYSLVYISPNSGTWVAFLIMIGMGFAWYGIAQWISDTMAQKNASSIKRLVEEIRIIDKGNLNHRVELETEDEFAEVGYRINEMVENILFLNKRNTELVGLNGRIEIDQLTAQMNPHFLYNTLEIIRNLVAFDATRSEKIIMDLTKILRYSVDRSKQEVLLEEDMKYLDCYLDIQRCRFGERFSCYIQMSDACKNCRVPKLLLQPLVENSIKYGFEKKMDLHISIKGDVEQGALKISVMDDGLGMESAAAALLEDQLVNYDNSAQSIGLRNLSRRLHLRYGKKSGLRIRNTEGVGFEVMVRIDQMEDT